MSTYLSDSELSRFNASEEVGWVDATPELCHAIEAAQVVSEFSDGAFDVTVGPLVNLWGFGPEETTFGPPNDQEVEAARARVGFRHLEADCSIPALRRGIPGLTLDMSAVGKGYAADRVAEMLEELGATDYMVEVGGETTALDGVVQDYPSGPSFDVRHALNEAMGQGVGCIRFAEETGAAVRRRAEIVVELVDLVARELVQQLARLVETAALFEEHPQGEAGLDEVRIPPHRFQELALRLFLLSLLLLIT